ncbi:MAG: putative Ig domain-containing protein [Terracidiphilus sp.]|jgi:hypothetical protein
MTSNCSWFQSLKRPESKGWLRFWFSLLLLLPAIPAFGQTSVVNTVSSWDGSSAAYSFGFPNGAAADTYGQTFTVPAGYPSITDINFRVGYNFGDGLTFTGYLMAWDGSEATGAVLFQSAPMSVNSATPGLAEVDFPITNVTLTAGNTYVFFLLAGAGSGGAATARFAITGNSSSYAGGNFVFTDSQGVFANLSNPWLQTDTASKFGDAVFAATFSTSPATHFLVSTPSTTTSGVAFSVTVTAQDSDNNTVTGYAGTVHFTSSDSSASLPADATLTNGVGTFPVTLNATGNQAVTATDTVNASITGTGSTTVDQAPAIDSASNAEFTVGKLSSFTVMATGYPSPTFSETGSLPGGVTLSSVGSLSGTPAAGSYGSYPITITATNGIGSNATQSFTLTILPDNQLWVGDSNNTTAAFSATGTPYPLSPELRSGSGGVAIDSLGNVWSLNSGTSSVSEFTSKGTVTNGPYTDGGLSTPSALAIDGLDQIWIVNSTNSISVFNSSGTAISTTAYTNAGLSSPTSVAVDISGNLWIANSNGNSVTKVLGVAAPTIPLATGVANNSPATEP